MNTINIIGRATDVPTIKYVGQSNRALAEFVLAVEDRQSPPDPATGHRPCFFFPVSIWGHKAEHAPVRIAKGQRVGITGSLAQEEFIPKGQTFSVRKTRIIADSFDPLDKSRSTLAQGS